MRVHHLDQVHWRWEAGDEVSADVVAGGGGGGGGVLNWDGRGGDEGCQG